MWHLDHKMKVNLGILLQFYESYEINIISPFYLLSWSILFFSVRSQKKENLVLFIKQSQVLDVCMSTLKTEQILCVVKLIVPVLSLILKIKRQEKEKEEYYEGRDVKKGRKEKGTWRKEKETEGAMVF